VPLLVAASYDGPPANGHSPQEIVPSSLVEEEPMPASETVDSLVRPLVESVSVEPATPESEQPSDTVAVIEQPTEAAPASEPTPEANVVAEQASQPPSTNEQSQVVAAVTEQPSEPAPVKEQPQETAVVEPASEPPSANQQPEVVAAVAEQPSEPAPVNEQPQETTLVQPVSEPPSANEQPQVVAAVAEQTAETKPLLAPEATPVVPEPARDSLLDCTALALALEQEAQFVLEATTPGHTPADTTGAVSEALESHAQLLLDSISEEAELEQTAIRAIVASFSERPAMSLLGTPVAVVKAPAPRSREWMQMPRPVIPAVAPQDPSAALLAQGPQAPTLNGPSLPPDLRELSESVPLQSGEPGKRAGFPAWMLSFVIAIVLLLGGISLMQYFSNRDAQDATGATQPGQASRSASTDSVLEEHPFAHSVEVSGVRITPGQNHKLQLQYVVVNHSPKELTGLGIRLAMHAANDSSTAAPLFTVFSKVPALGAYQSREIRTELDNDLRVSSLPDWQSLRPEILVSGRQ